MSTLFLRTLREDPADADVDSAKLLQRAGYIRKAAPGIWTWLPLGLSVLNKIEEIIREEINGIGAQEVHFPALLPREPYEATHRWEEYGDNIFRLKDRHESDYLLAPTHEEMFTLLVKDMYSSYKDLPVTLYQIQTKYRDEERPRAGILRGREFVMKDSYSFDVDDAGLERSYQAHREAYQRIFDRLGIEYVICAATSGAMGGSASEEFLAVSAAGEDTFVRSTDGDYAANVEAVVTPAPEALPLDGLPEAAVHDTPDAATIDSLVAWANGADLGRQVTAADTLKTVMLKVREPGKDWELLGVGLPGDREVDMKRIEASLEPAEVAVLEDKDFTANPFLVKGYLGPRALLANEVRFLVDPRVVEGTSWLAGADIAGKHYVNLVCGRDFTPDGTIEAAEVREGDPAPGGHGTLTLARGIEIGHIFQLGRKYTDAFGFDVLGENGKPVRVTMGSYGIGVSRLVAVLAEQFADDKGLVWPAEAAPADVHVVIANKDEAAITGAGTLVEAFDASGLEILFDERKASPGVKFKDAELIGVPWVVVVGRGWSEGTVELRERATGEVTQIAVDGAADEIIRRIRAGS